MYDLVKKGPVLNVLSFKEKSIWIKRTHVNVLMKCELNNLCLRDGEDNKDGLKVSKSYLNT